MFLAFKVVGPVIMKTKKALVLLLFFLFESISSEDVCSPAFCSLTGPEVRFPFRLVDRQHSSCGFPGFDLSCDEKNQTILKLPSSRSSVVIHISYVTQVIRVDPDFCGPERLIGIKLAGTLFEDSPFESYTFYNCSSPNATFNVPCISFPCLGSVNHSVYALETLKFSNGDIPESCKHIATVSVPVLKQYDGRDPRYTSYTLIMITGIPTLVSAIVLLCYIRCKVRNHDQGQQQSVNLSAMAITPQTRSTTGLDRTTIESYPKTIFGESCELPKDDSTCAICLSDYKPKEAVTTIPECSHYFHVDCVDEWLKLNATCPVCRKSPESASLVTPCSSLSLNSTNASHTTSQ